MESDYQQNQSVNISKDKNTHLVKLLFALTLAVILLAVVVWKGNLVTFDENYNKELPKEIQIIKERAESAPFEYKLVPNAIERINLPKPPDSNELDQQVYDGLRSTEPVEDYSDENNHVYYLDFQGQPLGDYVNSLPDQSQILIFQINDELTNLTQHFNNLFQRGRLSERIDGVVEYATIEPALAGSRNNGNYVSVYPSIRAVMVYAAGELMSRTDPENREQYEQQVQNLVNRQIGYGLYGQSDAEASLSLVNQYFRLLDSSETSPDEVINDGNN